MRGLVLAEKPSLMRSIQSAYRGEKLSFDLDFAAFHGHLMGLAQPADYHSEWKPWDLKTLPMIPAKFIYLPVDTRSVQQILSRIRGGGYGFLVNACDAGREGELIFWSFYEANGLSLPVKRLWSSTTEEIDLKKALHNLRPASDFDNLRASSKFRAEFDWLTGMNFSRAVSLKTNKKANIGRVVTPTLKMVVDREKEIRNFKPSAFYEGIVNIEAAGEKFPGVVLAPPEKKQSRYSNKKDAETALSTIGGTGEVLSVEAKKKSTKAPTLYSTSELQKDASRYFKFRATKTDSIAQELYEAGYISYPRTECRFIPTSMVAEIPKMLKPLENFPELIPAIKLITPASIRLATTGKTYVDDSKLTDHPAITPTKAAFDPASLSADQRKIYLLVAKRFLSIFLPPYVVGTTTALIESNGVSIKASGRTIVDKGFSILYQDKSKTVLLPPMKKGDKVKVIGKKLREGVTQPPSRYTEDTLIAAMENAGKLVAAAEQRAILRDACGLGTGATRAGILEKLESTGMCSIEKHFYCPTDFGIALIDAIGSRDICSPALTAKWEEQLRDLEKNGHPEKFKAAMLSYIQAETADLIANVSADLSAFRNEIVGVCPLCGRAVIASPNYFRCTNYKAEVDPCRFIVSRKETMGATISKTDITALLEGKPTDLKTLKASDGRTYKAALIINAEGRVVPAIGDNSVEQRSADRKNTTLIKGIGKCPLCKDGSIYRSRNYYLCTNRDRERARCSFIINPGLCSGHLTDSHIQALISGKETEPITFTWKSGKTGQARLRGELVSKGGTEKTFDLKFIFDH